MSEVRHVYILGAGFSMPLGGPSFNQLISNVEQKTVADIVGDSTHYPHVFLSDMPSIIHQLWSRIGRVGELNVEELLETIDYAAHYSQSEWKSGGHTIF